MNPLETRFISGQNDSAPGTRMMKRLATPVGSRRVRSKQSLRGLREKAKRFDSNLLRYTSSTSSTARISFSRAILLGTEPTRLLSRALVMVGVGSFRPMCRDFTRLRPGVLLFSSLPLNARPIRPKLMTASILFTRSTYFAVPVLLAADVLIPKVPSRA